MAKNNTAVNELKGAPSGTYPLQEILDLTKRLIEERRGLTALERYDLIMLSNGDNPLGVLEGIEAIYEKYWHERGGKPPEQKGEYI